VCVAGQPWWERRHLWEIVTFFCYRITELGARIALLGLFAVSACRESPESVVLPNMIRRAGHIHMGGNDQLTLQAP
jgi:hypothetical protein